MSLIALLAAALTLTASDLSALAKSRAGMIPQPLVAAWYWPFGSSGDHKQLQAANERISDLTKLKGDLEMKQKELQSEVNSAKAEAKAAVQQASEKRNEEIERLKRAHDDELAAARGVCDQRLAALQAETSQLEMQLSYSEKQRIVLQGLVEQPERLRAIQQGNCSIERTIWFCISAAGLSISGLFASQYFQLRAKRRQDIVRLIGQLSHSTP